MRNRKIIGILIAVVAVSSASGYAIYRVLKVNLPSNGIWEELTPFNYFDIWSDHPFGTEVVLNKPEVRYNLYRLERKETVSIGDNMITYKSHFNSDITVIITKSWGHESIHEKLSVGLEIPSKPLTFPYTEVNIELDKRPEAVNEELLEELGYEGSGLDERTREEMGIEGYFIFEFEGYYYVHSAWTKGPVTQISSPYMYPKEWEIGSKIWTIVYWSGHLEGREPFPGGFRALVRNETSLSPELEEEFKIILEAHGIDTGIWIDADITTYVYEETLVHFPIIDLDPEAFNWGEAMFVELRWLRDNGVVSGVTDVDIALISSACEFRTAGHNSRIVFYDGSWMGYNETGLPLTRAS